MNREEQAFLLQVYGEAYGPEAGPWNTSVTSKYLEYRIAAFFEDYFVIGENASICNIGIGEGSWDRYLSYRLNGGCLTSIDRDAVSCRQLALRLKNENNPNRVRIIPSDVMLVDSMDESFDIVTMIGSTRVESGLYGKILNKAIVLVKPGGSFFYQTIDREEEKEAFEELCKANNLKLEAYLLDTRYGYHAQYFKAVKPSPVEKEQNGN